VTFQYSKSLIERTQAYFKNRCGIDISEETANEYLRSFAKLYLAFARPNGGSLASGINAARDSAVAEEAGSDSIGVSNTYGTL